MVVHREHTAANVAPAIRTLLDQVNTAFPDRLKTTAGHDADGIWPSAAHTAANPNSDHEAGNALDIDDDLSGTDGKGISITPAMAAQLSRDDRCNYTIHDDVIYHDGVGRDYGGSNPHRGHIHISVHEAKRRDGRPWDIYGIDTAHPYLLTTTDTSMWGYPVAGSKHVRVILRGRKVRQVGGVVNGFMFVQRTIMLVRYRGWVDIRHLKRIV